MEKFRKFIYMNSSVNEKQPTYHCLLGEDEMTALGVSLSGVVQWMFEGTFTSVLVCPAE